MLLPACSVDTGLPAVLPPGCHIAAGLPCYCRRPAMLPPACQVAAGLPGCYLQVILPVGRRLAYLSAADPPLCCCWPALFLSLTFLHDHHQSRLVNIMIVMNVGCLPLQILYIFLFI
jgi:hypothetical protein